MLRVAGITATTRIQRYSGNQLVTIKCLKYELVSSHCARRTAITILGTQGIPMNVLHTPTDEHTIVFWRKIADIAEKHIKKGSYYIEVK